jgi:hypothetical protein
MNWVEEIEYYGELGARALDQARAFALWAEYAEGLCQ